MTDTHILHMLTPLKHMSPFDVNMALDAGYDAAIAYTNVMLDEVGGLVQDAIFSRPPKTGVRTGMFIGGKNAILALDMLSAAKKALVPPFGISFFADPAGSFTTAAAMVACVEKTLLDKKKRSLKDLKLAVFGATGVVGFSSAVIAALEGANVTLVGYDGTKRVSEAAREMGAEKIVLNVPGVNAGALEVLFRAGLRTDFFGAWMSAKPLGSFESYMLAGGMLL